MNEIAVTTPSAIARNAIFLARSNRVWLHPHPGCSTFACAIDLPLHSGVNLTSVTMMRRKTRMVVTQAVGSGIGITIFVVGLTKFKGISGFVLRQDYGGVVAPIWLDDHPGMAFLESNTATQTTTAGLGVLGSDHFYRSGEEKFSFSPTHSAKNGIK